MELVVVTWPPGQVVRWLLQEKMSRLRSYSGMIIREVIVVLCTCFLLALGIQLSDEFLILSQEHLVHDALSFQLILKVPSFKNSSNRSPHGLVFRLGVFDNFLDKGKELEPGANDKFK
jgi:hypothetical protein